MVGLTRGTVIACSVGVVSCVDVGGTGVKVADATGFDCGIEVAVAVAGRMGAIVLVGVGVAAGEG